MRVGIALLVSRDAAAISPITCSLQRLSLSPEICGDAGVAIPLLKRRAFAAVIVDLALGEQAHAILNQVASAPPNRSTVTFAINHNHADPLPAGVPRPQFVFERPLTEDSVRRTLGPAFALILRERRHFFRCPAAVAVVLQRPPREQVRCTSLNIAEDGMALSTFVPLQPGERVQVCFTLPGRDISIAADSAICWWETGHLGVRFLSLSDEHKSALQDWLAAKLEEMLPQFVTNSFDESEAESGGTGNARGYVVSR